MRALLITGAFGCALAAATSAAAQAPVPPAPAAPPPAAEPTGDAGSRVTTGQVPVVGGNAAGARERAIEDAIRQAVDLAIDDLIDPETRTAQAKAIRTLEARARSFVPRYRTLQEGEANGVYTVRLQAEVDLVALRNRIERAGWPSAAASARPAAATVLVVPADQTRVGFAAAVGAALADRGVRVAASAAPSPGAVRISVSETLADEGPLRGIGRVSAACAAEAWAATAPATPRTAKARGFGDRPAEARADCDARLARAAAGEIGAALIARQGPASELPIITIDADVVEPAAVSALLKSVREVGAVSSAELLQVGGGRIEIRARTRSTAGPLAATLSRDAAGVINLSDVQTSGDVIRLRARLRTPANPVTGSAP